MLLSDWGNPESKLAEKTRITKWILLCYQIEISNTYGGMAYSREFHLR